MQASPKTELSQGSTAYSGKWVPVQANIGCSSAVWECRSRAALAIVNPALEQVFAIRSARTSLFLPICLRRSRMVSVIFSREGAAISSSIAARPALVFKTRSLYRTLSLPYLFENLDLEFPYQVRRGISSCELPAPSCAGNSVSELPVWYPRFHR